MSSWSFFELVIIEIVSPCKLFLQLGSTIRYPTAIQQKRYLLLWKVLLFSTFQGQLLSDSFSAVRFDESGIHHYRLANDQSALKQFID
jgi:hypothetical protein